MAGKNIRRDERIPCKLPVLLTWTQENGSVLYANGKCRDISPMGLRVETSATIRVQSYVNVRVQQMDVAGSARVRYLRRGTIGNVIGLELGTRVRQQLLRALRETA